MRSSSNTISGDCDVMDTSFGSKGFNAQQHNRHRQKVTRFIKNRFFQKVFNFSNFRNQGLLSMKIEKNKKNFKHICEIYKFIHNTNFFKIYQIIE